MSLEGKRGDFKNFASTPALIDHRYFTKKLEMAKVEIDQELLINKN